jgi:hypothetical protein
LNPKWDYYCQFIIPTNFDLFTKVRVEIWDYDRGSVDDLIGIADLVLDDYFTPEMMDAKEVEVSFPILKKEKAVTDLLDGLKEGSTAKKTMKPKLPIALIPGKYPLYWHLFSVEFLRRKFGRQNFLERFKTTIFDIIYKW